jgi:starvation-inducible DNA-binding protein
MKACAATAVACTAALNVDSRLEAAGMLQVLLVDVIDLTSQGTQARWNLYGPMFRSVRLELDQMVDSARQYADQLAERCLALGVAADGRLATVTSTTHLDSFPGGRVEDRQVVHLISDRLHTVSAVGRSVLRSLGETDPVSQELVNGILQGLERHLWMFEAARIE